MPKAIYRALLTFIILFQITPAGAQNPRADSIFQLIKKHPGEDTVRAKLMFEYATACYPANSDSTFKYSALGLQLSEKLNFKYGMMRGLNASALNALRTSQFDKALQLYHKALDIAFIIKDFQFQIKVQNNLGILYQTTGVLDSSRKYLELSVELARLHGEEKMQAKGLSDLGSVLGMKGDYLQAVKCLLQALAIYETMKSPNDIVITHIRIGNQYSKIKDFRKSRDEYFLAKRLNDSLNNERNELNILMNLGLLYEHVKKDIDSARFYLLSGYVMAKKLNVEDVMLTTIVNLGNSYYSEKNFKKALEYYVEAYNSPLLNGRLYEQTAVLINLGSVYMNLGKSNEAEKLLTDGLALAVKNSFIEFQQIGCESLSLLASKQKKYDLAYKFLLRATELNDSIASRELKEQVAEVQFKYELEKKETQNRLLVKENELKAQVIFRQRLMVAGSFTILALIVILLFVILRSRNKQKTLNQKLDEQNQTLTHLNKTKDKFFSIVAHDLRSPFSALMSLLTELDDSYEDFDDESRRQIIHLLKGSSFNTYNLLVNLLDWAKTQREKIENRAENVNLGEIVEDAFSSLQTRASFKSQSLLNKVSPETIIYADPRIVRSLLINLINNGIKFTPESGIIQVLASSSGDWIQICVEDSGIGIPEKEIPNLFRIDSSFNRQGTEKEPGTGLGLIMCKEYVNILGGEISVVSSVGKGTTMCFTVQNSKH
ncbi:MAG: tetratricopeptide repeat-containing sensor histidine kinase [Bacteroidetes bacterium]|nr:tetratricopeptide repeat-containing sensor histidine kinase [Bacteroidota bacterium]